MRIGLKKQSVLIFFYSLILSVTLGLYGQIRFNRYSEFFHSQILKKSTDLLEQSLNLLKNTPSTTNYSQKLASIKKSLSLTYDKNIFDDLVFFKGGNVYTTSGVGNIQNYTRLFKKRDELTNYDKDSYYLIHGDKNEKETFLIGFITKSNLSKYMLSEHQLLDLYKNFSLKLIILIALITFFFLIFVQHNSFSELEKKLVEINLKNTELLELNKANQIEINSLKETATLQTNSTKEYKNFLNMLFKKISFLDKELCGETSLINFEKLNLYQLLLETQALIESELDIQNISIWTGFKLEGVKGKNIYTNNILFKIIIINLVNKILQLSDSLPQVNFYEKNGEYVLLLVNPKVSITLRKNKLSNYLQLNEQVLTKIIDSLGFKVFSTNKEIKIQIPNEINHKLAITPLVPANNVIKFIPNKKEI